MKQNLLLIILTFSCLTAFSQTYENKGKEIEKLIQTYYEYGMFNGAVLVAKDSNILYQVALGITDPIKQEPLELSTPFKISSVSKQFTAMCIMILNEKQLLSYDDKISNYLKDLPEYAKDITIRNLLNQTSGLRDYSTGNADYYDWTNKDILDFLKMDTSLLFSPNEKHHYCNTNYALLALIVESVVNKPFNHFLSENVFIPLKMKNSFTFNDTLKFNKAKKAVGYFYVTNEIKDDTSKITGPGGIYSSIGDLYKWNKALINYELVSKNTLEEALKKPLLDNDKHSNYGFGWVIRSDSLKTIEHTGGDGKNYSFLSLIRENNTSIIILTNNGSNKFYELKRNIQNILQDKPYSLPKKRKPKNEVSLTHGDIKKYAGRFKITDNFILTVTIEQNHLYVQSGGENTKDEYFPLSENEFFSKTEDAGITFTKNDNGEVDGLIFHYFFDGKASKIE